MNASRAWMTATAEAAPPFFPPTVIAEVKALACQLPAQLGLPLSRFSRSELRRFVLEQGIVAEISGTTIWRWLSEDAIRPWSRRSWVFPRDPAFAVKAGRVLDLYKRAWNGKPLDPNDFVLSADEKTGIQIRQRRHQTAPPRPSKPLRVEHEYRRRGTCAYHAAWDVHRAKLFGQVVDRSTIEHFDQLVAHVMRGEPYRSAKRVFWIVDNGTVHRGEKAVSRLQSQWSNLVLVHLPVHASWLNQIEIYFSVLQRKAITPDNFDSISALRSHILNFQNHYQRIAKPFEWKFTRQDLDRLLQSWESQPDLPRLAA